MSQEVRRGLAVGAAGRFASFVVSALAHVLGRPVAATEPSFDEWAARANLPYDNAQQEVLRQVHAHYAAHGSPGNSVTLRAVLGREPRSLRHFIEELAAGSASPLEPRVAPTPSRQER